MEEPEPWRRTGRKATDAHWLGLDVGVILEFPVYDDNGQRQGRIVGKLEGRGEDESTSEGKTWLVRLLAIEDEYFAWWAGTTFSSGKVPLHACARPHDRCSVQTFYRNALHMDVFRVLPARSALNLSWLTEAHKIEVEKHVAESPKESPRTPDAHADPPEGSAVKPGAEGIAGLAAALGAGDKVAGACPDEERKESAKKRKRGDEESENSATGCDKGQDLSRVLRKREAAPPEASALRFEIDKKKKKKRKKKKKDKDEKTKSSDSSESSSTDGSVFRLAALPKGVEKLQTLHQDQPGALANATLRRFNELLSRSVGGGTATSASALPAVARAYLTQIYLVKNPEDRIGLRNLRELRTLATCLDYLAQNDPLRAMDIIVQRMKAIEVFVSQGNWNQACLLELIPGEGEQRAWFRQELKAAQQEWKSEHKMQEDSWSRRRQSWEYQTRPPPNEDRKIDGEKSEQPPANPGGKGKKGKGKGRKGKRW